MPFRETPQGQTNFCKHRDDHDVSKCEKCIPKVQHTGLRNKCEKGRHPNYCPDCWESCPSCSDIVRKIGDIPDNAKLVTATDTNVGTTAKDTNVPTKGYVETVLEQFEKEFSEVFVNGKKGFISNILEDLMKQVITQMKPFLRTSFVTLIERQVEVLKKQKVKVEHAEDCLARTESDIYCDCSDYIILISKNYAIDEMVDVIKSFLPTNETKK